MNARFFRLMGASALTTCTVQPVLDVAHYHPPAVPVAGVVLGVAAVVSAVCIWFDDPIAEYLQIKASSVTAFAGTCLLTTLIAAVSVFAAAGNWLALQVIAGLILLLVVAGVALIIHLKRENHDEHDQNIYG